MWGFSKNINRVLIYFPSINHLSFQEKQIMNLRIKRNSHECTNNY